MKKIIYINNKSYIKRSQSLVKFRLVKIIILYGMVLKKFKNVFDKKKENKSLF